MDTGPNGSTLAKHHYVTREEIDRLNRQHLDALNATIIKLNNEKALLLEAARALAELEHVSEVWHAVKSQVGLKPFEIARKAIANATP